MTGRFHTITLGCKLNQFDTAGIEGELWRRGLRPQPEPEHADVVIVNTCTVTAKADAEARKLIRRVRRRNSLCRLIVTGCYAEADAVAIAEIAGVDRVVPRADRDGLPRILDELGIGDDDPAAADPRSTDRGCDAGASLPAVLHFGDRSRAFLKVQEGCRLSCSYCIIPTVRGPSRSVAPDALVRAVGRLFESGYREIVLTGVNTGDYGRDLEPRYDLARLLRRLLESCGPNRIRLNSLEPRTVTDEIIGLMGTDSGLAPHLQVPLQSGSERVLRSMRRNYGLSTYLDRIRCVRRAVPDAGLGADVIVGFPGETERDFRETLDFVSASPLNYLHVFAWSSRAGTPAAMMPGRVPAAEIRERSARLRRLGDELAHRFRRQFLGRRLDAVVLGGRRGDGRTRALTGNFIEVALDDAGTEPGAMIRVRLTEVDPDGASAVLDGVPARGPGDRATPRPEGPRPWTRISGARRAPPS